jgi:hypothetical protein
MANLIAIEKHFFTYNARKEDCIPCNAMRFLAISDQCRSSYAGMIIA